MVAHIRHHRLDANVREQVYYPAFFRGMTLAVHTSSDPLNTVGSVRETVQSIDRDQPIYRVRTMDQLVSSALAPARFTLLLLIIFAAVAASLAAVGIYGVMSNAVTQRTHEIGVRMALGAETSDVMKMILRYGMRLGAWGVAIGLAAAFILTSAMQRLLYGVSATDPATFVVIAAVLVAISLLACYIPARRATKVDPMVALRWE